MKFIFISIKIILFYFISLSYSYSIDAPNIKNLIIYEKKQKIKFFDFLNEAGNKVNLKDFESELIILNFWATWCAPCREEMPSLSNLQKLKDEKKLKIIPINIGGENISKSKKFFDELLIKELQVFVGDGAGIAKNLKLRGIPTTLFIDKDGYEFARIVGSIDFNSDEFLNWLNELN
ncbi:TlpA family protein disulfide reductase [Candidatus Pelagibacter sp.]|nr:TlpA family protein disulfide reductase [Candidatus Pelagibacter sp.]